MAWCPSVFPHNIPRMPVANTRRLCFVLVTNFYKASLLLPAYVLRTTYLHTYTSITIYNYMIKQYEFDDSYNFQLGLSCGTLYNLMLNITNMSNEFSTSNLRCKTCISNLLPRWKKHETWFILLIFVPCDFEWGCWADSRLCSPGNLSWGEGAWSVVVSGWKIARVEALWKRRHSPLVSYSLYPMFFCFKEIRVTWWFDIWLWVWLKLANSPSRKEKWNEILPIFTLQCYVEPSGDLYWIKFV